MSLDKSYDPDNIFAKIISGDMPCVKIFEDDDVLAFMDVFPQSEGHSLVVHKAAQATNILNVEASHLASIIAAVQKVARAAKAALSPDGIRVAQFNGSRAGQTVFHLHFHVIPVYEGKVVAPHAAGKPAETDALEAVASKIRAAL